MTDWADLFGDITLVQGVSWIIALVAFTLLAIRGWKLLGSAKDFMDDVKGEPARPGVPARPGLMERVGAIETGLSEVRHEVLPNTGTSLNDSARRTESAVNDLTESVAGLTESVAEAHKKLDNDNRRIDHLTDIARRNHPEEGQ